MCRTNTVLLFSELLLLYHQVYYHLLLTDPGGNISWCDSLAYFCGPIRLDSFFLFIIEPWDTLVIL